MTTETLKKKTTRYLQGRAMPAESRQIQTWLSCPGTEKLNLTEDEKAAIENDILGEIQAYTAYPLFYPRPEPWWQRLGTYFQVSRFL